MLEKLKYKYTNKADYRFFVPELSSRCFIDEYFECTYGYCVIKKEYSWNGCTAAPDFKQTKSAGMVHDSLYQYGRYLGLKRKVADRWFLYLLQRERFLLSGLYYLGVRLFGAIFYY